MSQKIHKRKALDENISFYQIYLRNFTQEGTFLSAEPYLEDIKQMGFDWIYLTPIHPIGIINRKGTLGSPYSITDYRAINPELGTLDDFRHFMQVAQKLGLKVMMDVVYNHTSVDSILSKTHPEWFIKDSLGNFSRKCDDWYDVIDLDFSSKDLWVELIAYLSQWKDEGIEGFRCDVASLVPSEFWITARTIIDPNYEMVWLAESVHPDFLLNMRNKGFNAWSDGELYQAFDVTYDYDGWEKLEDVWKGTRPITYYLEYVTIQQTSNPSYAKKIRFLENHDQKRALQRFSLSGRLENWTLLYQLIPGCTFVYMGQEMGLKHTPSLFEKDYIERKERKKSFETFFKKIFTITNDIKEKAIFFKWQYISEGLIMLERTDSKQHTWIAILNLDQRSGIISIGKKINGIDLISGKKILINETLDIPYMPLLIQCHM